MNFQCSRCKEITPHRPHSGQYYLCERCDSCHFIPANVRTPISINHEKHHYQVIFRAPAPRITNRNYYCDAETAEDARELAKNYLAADSIHDDQVRDFARWKVVEVNLLKPARR